ncbi:hypothetical protein FH972_026593 [Carpinus fangiana]|uniref:histidine kinase n=1 Tax=Carpinus fangiana TaxID=176857 RepID=A0A5N6L5E0_9ROSI|nr:hypothetical protein FH972_026593 [Carpinus fangiana]
MGCGTYPASSSICQYTVALPSANHPDEQPLLVICDLGEDLRFAHLNCFESGMRFYAGVPIKSPNGHQIGSYCVIDDKPRSGLEPEQIGFLHDMAATVSTHLANARLKTDYRRSDRMVRGVGALVEGKTSIRDWWYNAKNPDRFASPIPKGEGHMSAKQDEQESQVHQRSALHRWPREEPPTRIGSKPRTSRRKPGLKTDTTLLRTLPGKRNEPSGAALSSLFGRASNLIREAVELEGVVFLDARTKNFGGYVPTMHASPTTHRTLSSSSSDGEATGSENKSGVDTVSDDEKAFCQVLGFSTGVQATINGDKPPEAHLQVGEQTMAALLRRYPLGKVFHYETLGGISSSSESEPGAQVSENNDAGAGSRGARHRRKEKRLKLLQTAFPGFRSLMFLPLWDLQKNRWYGATFAWTNGEMRLFSEDGELSYLAAFGNTIMAEVAHLDALLADRAKADFISSISHELRSPLHGILGSAEFLNDTAVNGFQSDMIHNIETCGRTLLDTIDHLLDFAKINHLSTTPAAPHSRGRSLSGSGSGPSNGGYSTSSDAHTDIAAVTEEVVHTMVSSNDSLASSYRKSQGDNGNSTQISSPGQHVRVVVDIQHATSWQFQIQSGAWRRIVMNLIGNSLKYTDRGYISVRLSLEGDDSSNSCSLKLIVTDTGRGISKTFVKNNLFTPFVQEDSFSAGTGLGLSIVHQIVKSLNGQIAVRSRQNVGTEIEVTVPTKRLALSRPSDADAANLLRTIRSASSHARGLRVYVQCPYRQALAAGSDRLKEQAEQLGGPMWRESIERLCTEWFEMEVLSTDDITPDIIITDWFVGQDSTIARKTVEDSRKEGRPATIVSCSDIKTVFRECQQEYGDVSLSLTDRLQFIKQPTGPHNLAAALLRLFEGQTVHATARDSEEPYQSPMDFTRSPGCVGESEQYPWSLPTPRAEIHSRPSSSPSSPQTAELATSSNRAVLLVDDNKINLALLSRFMGQLSIPYVTAENGLLALEEYKKGEGDIKYVFMDLSMPVMDGIASTREIRQHEKVAGLDRATIVALTGLASEASQQEAFASGIDRFLTKPVKFSMMKSLMGE